MLAAWILTAALHLPLWAACGAALRRFHRKGTD
jgi:hypothetical protein